MAGLDQFDIRILDALQRDASLSMDALAERAGLSRNACWRRVKQLEEAGVIRGRVALLDPSRVGCTLTAVVLIKAAAHDADWLIRFDRAVRLMPQIQAAHRMAGEVDYILKVRLSDMPAYDAFYKDLTQRVPLQDVSASFVMEDLKDDTALPLPGQVG